MTHISRFIAPALFLLLAAACDNDPGKDKPKAAVGAPAATAAGQAPTGAQNYDLSGKNSKLQFVGAKVTAKHDGAFGAFIGKIQLVDGDPEKSSVNVEIDMASLSADDEKLTSHLKSGDFFDVEKHPKARFVSTSIKKNAENGATHSVTGNLELRGTTKSITFPAKISVEEGAVRVNAEFSINRKDFGVVYAGMPDDLIKDEVLLKLDVRADKAAAS
jgi:polyisoprenoid-binding protein YceI